MKTFEDLTLGEIKKVERYANKQFGRTDCKLTAWSCDGEIDIFNFVEVKCEIMYNNLTEVVPNSVTLNVYLPDRRRSYVSCL